LPPNAEEVVDWNGGTRIGAALRALTRTNVVRGSVVVICSDVKGVKTRVEFDAGPITRCGDMLWASGQRDMRDAVVTGELRQPRRRPDEPPEQPPSAPARARRSSASASAVGSRAGGNVGA
jgi:uncharacterized protein with von Willebrand factor type A (vWA) domain